VRAFQAARLGAQATPGEINRELAIVRRAFRLAVDADKYHGRVPKIRMLQEHNVRAGFFDDAMFAAVRAQLPAALQSVVTFAYVTGWRVQSEVLPLEWRHVDRTVGEARLEPGTTKNQAGRVFPFTAELRTLVDGLWREHEALAKAGTICRFVFQRHGKRIKDFRAAWKTACAAVGFPGRIPHDLRRSAVRNMERAGLSRSVAMQLTGHKTEAVYRRYAITSEADLREGVDRLNGVAGPRGGAKQSA
jgi:integrase